MKTFNKRVLFAAILGLLLSITAFAQMIIPCSHLVPLHPRGDIFWGPYGRTIVPCEHLVPLHPRGDIVY